MFSVTDYAGTVVSGEKEKKVGQIAVTLSNMAQRDFGLIALAAGNPLATELRLRLEAFHRSPETASMVRRAKEEIQRRIDLGELTEKEQELLDEMGGL